MLKKTRILIVFLIILSFILFVNTNMTYAITPSSESQYEGIDVSDWQGYIDYKQVREAQIEIVYIKASQGSETKDPYFDLNYENAKANGLKVGFYHFLTATNTRRSGAGGKLFCISNIGKTVRLQTSDGL